MHAFAGGQSSIRRQSCYTLKAKQNNGNHTNTTIQQMTTMATEHKQYYTPTYVNYSISN